MEPLCSNFPNYGHVTLPKKEPIADFFCEFCAIPQKTFRLLVSSYFTTELYWETLSLLHNTGLSTETSHSTLVFKFRTRLNI